MGRLPKAILFDLDDTIISFGGRESLLHEVALEFREELAPALPREVAGQVESAFLTFWNDPSQYAKWRNDLLTARTLIVTNLFDREQIASPKVAHDFARRFHERRESGEGRLFPGAITTVEELRRCGVRLALVTNGHADSQRAKIRTFGLERLFDHIQIEGEVGFGKPEERAYTHALAALQSRPEETWMVGDHLLWEVAAPQRLGIFAIWHDHVGKGLPANSNVIPDRIIRSIPELLE
jgi:putative hydrolase of the HAD superfamily